MAQGINHRSITRLPSRRRPISRLEPVYTQWTTRLPEEKVSLPCAAARLRAPSEGFRHFALSPARVLPSFLSARVFVKASWCEKKQLQEHERICEKLYFFSGMQKRMAWSYNAFTDRYAATMRVGCISFEDAWGVNTRTLSDFMVVMKILVVKDAWFANPSVLCIRGEGLHGIIIRGKRVWIHRVKGFFL